MTTRAIFITLISVALLILVAGGVSYLVWTNQPSADVSSPPVPPAPKIANNQFPPVPAEPRIKGDTIDDGIVDVLDINGLIAHWRQTNADYNLVDDSQGEVNILNALDLSQTIKYWRCLELKEGCEYKQ